MYMAHLFHNDYEQLLKTAPYAKKQYSLLVLLSAPTLSASQKKACLKKFLETAQAPTVLTHLAQLLLDEHRIELLPEVFRAIIIQYEEKQGIVPFIIQSVEPLKYLNKLIYSKFFS